MGHDLPMQRNERLQVSEKRKRTLFNRRRLNCLWYAPGLINRSILNLQSRLELLQEICTIVVERGGFELAWIGWIDNATGRVESVAAWSERSDVLDSNLMCADYRLEGPGPAEIAIWSEKPYICNDYLEDPAIIPWRDQGLRCGLRSSASFPLRENGAVVGVISVHSATPGYFQSKELELIEEAVTELSLALASLTLPEDREQFREAESLLASIMRSSHDAIIGKTLDGTITSWNCAAEQMFGYTKEEICGRNVTILIPEDRLQEERYIVSQIQLGVQTRAHETIRVRKDGSQFPISLTISPIRSPGGQVIGASAIARDITDLKLAQVRSILDQESTR
jgi:PAS domain S-box-containing protein